MAGAVSRVESARLIQETEIRTLHVEAHRGHLAAMFGEVLKDRRQQELDRAGLGGEPRDARDVEVRGFRTQQEVGIQVYRRLEPARRVEPHWNSGRLRRVA